MILKCMDLHTHLNFLETEPDVAVEEALAAGVERMITIGTSHRIIL